MLTPQRSRWLRRRADVPTPATFIDLSVTGASFNFVAPQASPDYRRGDLVVITIDDHRGAATVRHARSDHDVVVLGVEFGEESLDLASEVYRIVEEHRGGRYGLQLHWEHAR